jgi:hypothetical protein
VLLCAGLAIRVALEMTDKITTNRNDPDLGYGVDEEPVPQNKKYLVLSAEERKRGFVRPLRYSYIHRKEWGGCDKVTSMGTAIAETYARNPNFYGATYCATCLKHRPLDEFAWVEETGEYTDIRVGS